MNNEILQTFYQRMLPLFPPQAEKFLTTARPEIWKSRSFRYTFSVPAMIKISHIIEDTVIANRRAATLHVSFQHLSRLLPQKARYQRVAKAAQGLWLYGSCDLAEAELASLPRTTVIDTSNTLLLKYWFVVAYGAGVGMSQLAEEVCS